MKRNLKARIVQEYNTQVNFAKAIGIDPARISNFLNDNISLKPEEEKAIWEGLKITEKEFRKLAKKSQEFLNVPV